MKKRETLFRENVVNPFLDKLKNSHWFSIQQVSLRGHPDKVGVVNGCFVAIELKDIDEEPRPLQQYHLDKIEKSGGVALCATKDNWENIKQILNELSQSSNKGEEWKHQQLS